MFISYGTRSPVSHSAATGTMVAGIYESLASMMHQATAAPIGQPQIEVTPALHLQMKQSLFLRLLIRSRSYCNQSRLNLALFQGAGTYSRLPQEQTHVTANW